MVRWSWICSALWLSLGSPISSYQGTSKPNSWACWPRCFEKIADRHKSGMFCLETLEPDRWRRHLLQQPWNAIGSLRIARSPGQYMISIVELARWAIFADKRISVKDQKTVWLKRNNGLETAYYRSGQSKPSLIDLYLSLNFLVQIGIQYISPAIKYFQYHQSCLKKIYNKYSRAITSWCLPKDLNTEPQPMPCLSFKSGDTGEGGNWGIPGSNGSGGEKRLSAPRGWLFAVERSLDMFFFNDILVSIPKKESIQNLFHDYGNNYHRHMGKQRFFECRFHVVIHRCEMILPQCAWTFACCNQATSFSSFNPALSQAQRLFKFRTCQVYWTKRLKQRID